MYQSYAREASEKGVVEIFLDAVACLVGGLSQEHDLAVDRAGGGHAEGARPLPRALPPPGRRVLLRSGPEDGEGHAHRNRAGPDRRRASGDLDQLTANPE